MDQVNISIIVQSDIHNRLSSCQNPGNTISSDVNCFLVSDTELKELIEIKYYMSRQHLLASVYRKQTILKKVKQFIVKLLIEELFLHQWDVSHIFWPEIFDNNPQMIPPDRQVSLTRCASPPRMALISL